MVESQVSCLSSWDERFGLPRNTLHQNLQVATGKASPWQEDDFKRASQMEGGLARVQIPAPLCPGLVTPSKWFPSLDLSCLVCVRRLRWPPTLSCLNHARVNQM